MIGIYVISIVFMLIGFLVSRQLKRKFKEYSEVTIGSGITGKEIGTLLNKNLSHEKV